jgi:hypothetical protein
MYSQRASSRTKVLLSERIAVKSKLSRLFTVAKPRLLDAALDHPTFALDQLEFGQAQQVAWVIDALGGALLRELVVFAQEGRQLERLEMMGEQQLRRIAHDPTPASRSR